ncbi:MAG: tricarballylate utilization 4Fe-4S protein TcuB [Betaproteobacteria bacterium]|nr:tricarballylate utilization 4Fe-4S protein TcuB [Betaproteobacteria bacterium]
MSLDELIQEAQRQLRICNACRYCEGFCAVFPALERRLEFTEDDVHYLANLCHNCGSCYYACQYAPPHEFNLNFPRTLARVRAQTYRRYAWPAFLGRLYERNGAAVAAVMAACFLGVLLAMALAIEPWRLFGAHPDIAGSFYAVLRHGAMAGVFGLVFVFVVAAMAASASRFFVSTDFDSLKGGLADSLTLKYLGGGGEGCTYPQDEASGARRVFHHFTFYGFLLCFAATCVGTLYHYGFGWKAPYPFLSLPVILGTLGGVGLLLGPAGLAWLKRKADASLKDEAQRGMDDGFLLLLFLTSLTGLLLLAFRETHAMGVLLAVHLAMVLALFLTLPYGKFMHGLYRLAALARFHAERKLPPPRVGSE